MARVLIHVLSLACRRHSGSARETGLRRSARSGAASAMRWTVVDCNAESRRTVRSSGWTDLPTAGNGCTTSGGTHAPARSATRAMPITGRWSAVTGRAGPSLVADVRTRHEANPRQPQASTTIEAEELAAKGRLLRPHTVHCGPGGIFMSNLGGANAPTAREGWRSYDHDTFEVTGAWETDRGEQHFAYDVWWHLNDDVAITSEWATPS